MANEQVPESMADKVCHIFKLPVEIGQGVVAGEIANFKVRISNVDLADASGNAVTQTVVTLLNKAELQPLLNTKLVSKEIRNHVEGRIAADVSAGQIAIQLNITDRPLNEEPDAEEQEEIDHEGVEQKVPDGFIDEGKFASGRTFKHCLAYVPIGLVDITAHESDIAGGWKGRDVVEHEAYLDDDPESIMMAKVIIKRDGAGDWVVKVLWAEVKTLWPMHEDKNIQTRDLPNGEIQQYDPTVEVFDALVVEMQAGVEDYIQRSLSNILPRNAALSLENLCSFQQLVVGTADGVASASSEWTTRSFHDIRHRFVVDQQLHHLDLGEIDVEELPYEPRPKTKAESQQEVESDR
ncbi:hypothetical protein CLAFUW4_10739 [Fulvia fulva]|uniref:Uncharacterized protein n=1 Tax=Passalora fulva TaxID=5499 RepID=A0A9Q8LES1_PASFU|nr:uncharacterized protein CLAFUR5_05352 [Fulvia fulva]KAK4615952.1 hypothetical protein CLAFUR4_10744 [Fulvia fulva]KAK4616525.1 hypothetical protein CLAFUR0_10751 [Fulvia fulva]UJO16047.1 hypothetical protein CLAFUR5_05352 [Fulvia fulva]WPV19187.1 hypothetical protein CLAFUW4_10739 [Fulvia fulva]WPV33704.1 hypothetical protein CLAFUW7_10741 [Fulvia fulva]